MLTLAGVFSCANSHFRYWAYRRKIGNPFPLRVAVRQWFHRFAFEWRHNYKATADKPAAARKGITAADVLIKPASADNSQQGGVQPDAGRLEALRELAQQSQGLGLYDLPKP